MSKTKETLEFSDYNLTGNLNQKYHDIVNCRIVKPPYSKRLGHSSFFLDKRQGFTSVTKSTCHDCGIIPSPPLPEPDLQNQLFDWGTIEDVIELDGIKFYMWVNYDKTVMRIYIEGERDINPNGGAQKCCFYQVWPAFCTRPTGYFRFIKTNFVKWLPKFIMNWFSTPLEYDSETGIQINQQTPWGVDAKFSDALVRNWTDTFNTSTIEVGDYLYAYGLNNTVVTNQPGIPGQVSQITGVTPTEIDVLTPWAWFATWQQEGEGIRYRIYPDWGEVFLIDTCDGLYAYTYGDQIDVEDVWPYADATWPFVPTGLTTESSEFVGLNTGRINYLTNDGYLNYAGLGTQLFYRTAEQSVFVGTDVVAAPTFQQYTLLFKPKWLSVVRYIINDDWSVSFDFGNSDLNIGLWDKYSYTNYKSSFYFMWSNKRLYALSISPTTYGTYATQLEDMSALIKGELENILPTDQVRIQWTEQNLKIYINSDFRGNGIYNKTKVLIYDKDYQFWHKWEICWGQISWDYCEDVYYGGDIYNQCWDIDFYDCQTEQGIEFEQRLTVMFGENEIGENPVNMWQPKSIVNPKFIMGHNSNLTDGNFYIKFDMLSNCYKPEWIVANPESICYVNLLNKIKNGEEVFPSKDALRLLNKCSNYNNPCEWSWNSYTNLIQSNKCWCPDERPVFADYCVCINDEKYYLSPFSKVTFYPPVDMWANLYKIDIVAPWRDNIEFGWLMLPFYRKGADERDLGACDNEWDCTCIEDCTCSQAVDRQCWCE